MMTTAMMTAAVMAVPGPVSPMAVTTLSMLSGSTPTALAALLVGVGAAVLARVALGRRSTTDGMAGVVQATA